MLGRTLGRTLGRIALLAATLSAATLMQGTAPALASANLVVNGNFEQVTAASNLALGSGQINATDLTGWTNGTNNGQFGYNFLFLPGTVDTTGALGFYYGALALWGPDNGGVVNPGGTSQNTGVSPVGGNFIADDGAFDQATLSQTIPNLTPGTNYALTFWWAAGQQASFNGATTEAWTVGFGNQTVSTPVVTTPSHGFTPWMQATFIVSADSTSDLLSFLAVGTPGGQPPFSLLDGVSLVAAPEPSTWAILAIGCLVLLVGRRWWAAIS